MTDLRLIHGGGEDWDKRVRRTNLKAALNSLIVESLRAIGSKGEPVGSHAAKAVVDVLNAIVKLEASGDEWNLAKILTDVLGSANKTVANREDVFLSPEGELCQSAMMVVAELLCPDVAAKGRAGQRRDRLRGAISYYNRRRGE